MKTPNLDDIEIERSQEIGETIKQLELGDGIKATNNQLDRYILGVVVEKVDRPNDKRFYKAIVEQPDEKLVEIHANWRDIPLSHDDKETPFTGLLIEPFDNTAPAVTDIEILNK
jgi:hypothetical protein